MEPRMREIANELIDAFADPGEVDFIARFANRLLMNVIAEELNIAKEDMPQLQYMARSIEKIRSKPDGRLLSRMVRAELDGRQSRHARAL
jgi:cytochrome P450